MSDDLRAQLGATDIYLIDQILRGRFDSCRSVLDVGCGHGRNLVYFIRHGVDLYGIDSDPEAIAVCRDLIVRNDPRSPAHEHDRPSRRFRVAEVTDIPFDDGSFDAVICNAVLHFLDDRTFDAGVDELWRVLASGGLLFVRLASRIGLEDRIEPLGAGRYRLPDGTDRYLVTEPQLLALTDRLGGRLADPIKTTNVQGLRCMTTWCVFKPA